MGQRFDSGRRHMQHTHKKVRSRVLNGVGATYQTRNDRRARHLKHTTSNQNELDELPRVLAAGAAVNRRGTPRRREIFTTPPAVSYDPVGNLSCPRRREF